MNDQRKSQRHQDAARARVKRLVGRDLEATLHDISSTGLCLVLSEELRDSEPVLIHLISPEIDVKVPAAVVHTSPASSGYQTGFRFRPGISRANREELERWQANFQSLASV